MPSMTTSRLTSIAVAITALALTSGCVTTDGGSAGGAASRSISEDVSSVERTARAAKEHADTSRRKLAAAEKHAYGWPIKPFDRQHPVRGFFGDPRIANHGESRQFHFGIDISAPNGTPVYATISGVVSIHPLHPTTILVVGDTGVEFSYWHVVPLVRGGERAVPYRTVIGHIEAPYGHVHFSEKRTGRYLNPLRQGALGPFADATTPTVRSVALRSGELVAETYDETPLAVPRPWHDLPVMPALVRWRLLDARGRVVIGWRTAVDFRLTIPHASVFDDTWASGTTQNHVRAPGRYRLALTHDLPEDRYVVEVAVSDTRANASRQRFPLDLSTS